VETHQMFTDYQTALRCLILSVACRTGRLLYFSGIFGHRALTLTICIVSHI
jgi:hypothetical protein